MHQKSNKKRTIIEEIAFIQNKKQKLSNEEISKLTLFEQIQVLQQNKSQNF